mmetsp:Transcript_73037/g.143215  ORF Transcript_73037/g.143215 Transcript_73037/m.143215 type:complete len:280 (-) Transcript_73037:192-1031(-)
MPGYSPYATSSSGYGEGASPPYRRRDDQYGGMFRGLGVGSKDVACGKRSSSLKRLHDATHFPMGCKMWDERGPSLAKEHYSDPGVVYATREAPDKNMSAVDLRHGRHNPTAHYRSEQRERFAYPIPQPCDYIEKPTSQVHFGDDRPELITQSKMVHGLIAADDAQRAAALRAAGQGTLVPTSAWAKPTRCNPVTGGPRSIDNHDLGMGSNMNFPRMSHNSSAIIMEANVRNPIHGYHVPLDIHGSTVDPRASTTADIIREANASVPHLRSLGALRPPNR